MLSINWSRAFNADKSETAAAWAMIFPDCGYPADPIYVAPVGEATPADLCELPVSAVVGGMRFTFDGDSEGLSDGRVVNCGCYDGFGCDSYGE